MTLAAPSGAFSAFCMAAMPFNAHLSWGHFSISTLMSPRLERSQSAVGLPPQGLLPRPRFNVAHHR
eukprot:CAMPEP_0171264558 /NCGR_PEP_ID=MMETSP0790-20130122/57674_1 /TAXON_ID=2925 /ORGANISM="Alexandrium catenella, Strain OF101" /LENGTH=65 /DNA_ID=CAMNT_0011733205 /DNA_START=26 /DNA_END=220 /DNA_ORIENTATION=+